MKSSFILLFSIALLFSSCSDKLEKPISEPLDSNILKEVKEKEPDFFTLYEEISPNLKSFFIGDEIRQAKYGDITYRQFYNFYHAMGDSIFMNQVKEEAISEWNTLYLPIQQGIDSIADSWKPIYEKSLNKYVNLELIETQRVSDNKVKFSILCQARNTTIQAMNFLLELVPYDTTKETLSTDVYTSQDFRTHLASASMIVPKDTVDFNDLLSLWNNYNIRFGVKGLLTPDMFDFNLEQTAIPEYVMKYYDNPDTYGGFIAGSMLNQNTFMALDPYIRKYRQDTLEKLDSICFQFNKELLDFVEN